LEASYGGLLEATPDALVVVNADGKIVLSNVRAEKQFGYRRTELLGQPATSIIPEGFMGQPMHDARELSDALTQQTGGAIELQGRRKDGSTFPVELRLTSAGTEGTLLTASIRDISARKRAEANLLQKSEELNRAQITLNCIGDAVVCTDLMANITFLNPVAARMTGWLLQEAPGRPLAEVFRIVAPASDDGVNSADFAILRKRVAPLPTQCVLVRRDGFEIQIEISAALIHDCRGQVTGAVIVFRDTSAVRAMAQQMAHAATHDFLTGLPNLMLLNDRISQAIQVERRRKRRVAVLFLDLDGFKHINDSLGHPIGDKLLQSVAKRLVNCVRSSDTVGRQGGDEFVVLLSGVPGLEDAAHMARRLLQAVKGGHSVDEHDLHITTSIGVSVFPDDGLDAESLIKNADTAMYQAKENGRQGFQFFKPAMSLRAVERRSIEEDLRRALERQEFSLCYQPKVSLTTGRIVGAEALIRWAHPTRGPLLPAQFIPVAEESGLILPIGNWVLREACTQARVWADEGLPAVSMAVNVSAMEFLGENFLDGLFAALDETRLPPSCLELEVTESVLMKRVECAAAILQTLRQTGVRVAVDDFGTGYSSLSYLRKFPIDTLKIDQSFVRHIANGGDDIAIVVAVISMARSLKLQVVAEGVETKQELEFLRAHQCGQAQGYYFSRPVPPEQFSSLLRTESGRRPPARSAARRSNLAQESHG
jgi:diguanylate cyclase (GGDEF)-like protein/PAS domain S-box-containing protein